MKQLVFSTNHSIVICVMFLFIQGEVCTGCSARIHLYCAEKLFGDRLVSLCAYVTTTYEKMAGLIIVPIKFDHVFRINDFTGVYV